MQHVVVLFSNESEFLKTNRFNEWFNDSLTSIVARFVSEWISRGFSNGRTHHCKAAYLGCQIMKFCRRMFLFCILFEGVLCILRIFQLPTIICTYFQFWKGMDTDLVQVYYVMQDKKIIVVMHCFFFFCCKWITSSWTVWNANHWRPYTVVITTNSFTFTPLIESQLIPKYSK